MIELMILWFIQLVSNLFPTVLTVQTDQAGIIGLVRKLHGLGMTILNVQIVSDGGEFAEID
jgi:hypothetical protein